MSPLDAIDRKLLALLQTDDQRPLSELSRKTGVAASTINDRVKKLKAAGVIAAFQARVAPEAAGLDLLAFMLVGWSDPKVEARFLDKMRKSPAVLECHHVTGAWNYLLKVRIRNTRALEAFMADTVKAVNGVQRTETLIALSTAKETTVLDVSDTDER
jgi:Lrp/AsnC family transcriptional regulator, leucine-responsive regulatory protein